MQGYRKLLLLLIPNGLTIVVIAAVDDPMLISLSL